MSINDRIRELMRESSMTVSGFASSINLNRGTLQNIVGPRNSKPNPDIVAAILAKYPLVSSEWLISGKGEMIDATRRKHLSSGSSTEKWTSDQVVAFELSQGDRDQEEAIPFVPIAAEGSYLQGFADEEYIEHMPKFYLPFLGLGQGVYAFQVRGDSMSDRFNNGDVVFGQKVEQNDALRWGEVYVLLCNDGLVVKELRRGPDDKHFTLRSYNEHFDPYDILKSEVRQLYRYQASISFNSSNPNRGGVVSFLKALSEQMGQVQNSLGNLPGAK